MDLETIVREARINKNDKELVIQTFRKYKKLRHQHFGSKKEEEPEVIEKRKARIRKRLSGEYDEERYEENSEEIKISNKDQEEFNYFQDKNFFNLYCSIYNSEPLIQDSIKRSLFVRAISRIVDLSNSTFYVNHGEYSGTNTCISLLGLEKNGKKIKKKQVSEPISSKVFSLWIDSLGHLEVELSGLKEYMPTKLGRYLRISKDRFDNYHPSYEYVIKNLKERGNLFGLEDFMFDLARENELDEKAVSKYFIIIRKVPIEVRKDIENIRKTSNKKSKELNNCIYNLLSESINNKSSISSLVTLLTTFNISIPENQVIEAIVSYEPKLIKIMENDKDAIEYLSKNTQKILILEKAIGSNDLFSHYLDVAEKVSELDDFKSNKASYTNLSAEIFKDYFTKKENSLKYEEVKYKEVQDKCYHAIESIRSLDWIFKELAINLSISAANNLERSIRLNRESYNLPLDKLVDIVVSSFKINGEKAKNFLEYVVEYKENENN